MARFAHDAAGALGFKERLADLGLAGVGAYGLFNTVYYTAAFYFVWAYVVRVPRGQSPPPFQQPFLPASTGLRSTRCTTQPLFASCGPDVTSHRWRAMSVLHAMKPCTKGAQSV